MDAREHLINPNQSFKFGRARTSAVKRRPVGVLQSTLEELSSRTASLIRTSCDPELRYLRLKTPGLRGRGHIPLNKVLWLHPLGLRHIKALRGRLQTGLSRTGLFESV